jgi:protein-tyrosine-phosphatase
VGEYLLRDYAQKSSSAPVRQIEFNSAGIWGSMGGMHEHSLTYLSTLGIDGKSFQSKKLNRTLILTYDLILVFEKYMISDSIAPFLKTDAKSEYEQMKQKFSLFTDAAGESGEIEDPYGYGKREYFRILNDISRCAEKIVQKWESKAVSLDNYIK